MTTAWEANARVGTRVRVNNRLLVLFGEKGVIVAMGMRQLDARPTWCLVDLADGITPWRFELADLDIVPSPSESNDK